MPWSHKPFAKKISTIFNYKQMSTFQLKNYKISDNILCDNYKKYTSTLPEN